MTPPAAAGCILGVLVLGTIQGLCQVSSSAPINYTGIPNGDYSPEWQNYFEVTDSLTGVDFDLGRNYAGNIDVQRSGHTNNTLFFWGFEKENGSLTARAGNRSSEPWAIWLQGGPGTSSLYGMLTGNGPIGVDPGGNSVSQNKHAWSNLTDYIWVDQPVGVGYATADSNGFVANEDEVGADFVGFLSNLVKVFPSLATRPLYLTGESYAGRYIPYIAQALFSLSSPPVKLAKIVVGNPAFGSFHEFKTMPTMSLIETYPQIIGYNTDVYDYFHTQSHLCGLDINLTYPQTGGKLAPVNLIPGQLQSPNTTNSNNQEQQKHNRNHNHNFLLEVQARSAELQASGAFEPGLVSRRDLGRRDLTGRPNTSIDPWYGCLIWDEMVDYAVNFTYPWNVSQDFDIFDIPDALDPGVSYNASFFLNDNNVRKAIHAPTQQWQQTINYPWGSQNNGSDSSPEPMVFFDELATNMTNNGVQMIIYIGNDDAISPHFGTEVSIQNTTFGGIQGFTRKPATPWWDDDRRWSGIVHQERNWTYVLFYGTGHEVAAGQPEAAFTFVREFVVGNNQTGLVQTVNQSTSVVGGENPSLQQSVIPGQSGIAFGSTTTQGQTAWPAATVAAFDSYINLASITGTSDLKSSATATAGAKSAAASDFALSKTLLTLASFLLVVICL